ncbi:unnamed protein product [Medioppia subpectinata]|uniref:Uncharacterized protein n=1 Tax=Medioppia subpectinata TaxID=1979941 RepID=A0A7R9PVJ9_9ACAR|nr:unnamed protein product [Medioppia subpectinata]CAG2102777.1 unnamed protein product [Medioppia subpectinata]
MQPKSEYNVIVSLNNYAGQSNITCELTNELKGFKVSKRSYFDSNNQFQKITLQAGADWPEGDYDLSIISTDGLVNKKQVIQYNYKVFVIMVQTDKAIYKPGQDVQLRAVILDNLLRAVPPDLIEDLKIFILDPQNVPLLEMRRDLGFKTKDQQLYNVNMFNYTNGVTDDITFKLHDASKPGQWTIQVATHSQLENYTFYVDYYTLPMANVTINLPDYVKFDHATLDYSVDVFYTFGKPVDGYVEIKIEDYKACEKLVKIDPDHSWIKNLTLEHGQIKGTLNLQDTKLLFANNCSQITLNISAKAYDKNTDTVYFNYEVLDVIESEIKGEFLNKQLVYRPGKSIINEVTFQVNIPVVDAGKKAQLVVTAEPESNLFLLAIDEAILALKQGNDLSEIRVLNNLKTNVQYKYDTDSFLSTGMVFMTNGQKECKNSKLMSSFDGKEANKIDGYDPDDGGDGDSHNPKTNNAIRKNFRETWIWDRIDIPHGKHRIGIRSTVPDSITSWKVTAFALHPEKGLGLTTNPAYVTVFRPFFLKLNLPYSVKRNETSEFHVLLFNYKNETLDITLDVYQNSTDKHKTMIKIDIYKHVVVDLLMFENDVNKLTTSVKSVLPKDRVVGSELLLMTATTELMTVQWTDKLQGLEQNYSMKFDFSKPTGCCQQRIDFGFPKVYWLDYAIATNRSDQDMKNQAVSDITYTYSLLCWHVVYDGSFVYYEQYNPNGGQDNVVLDKRAAFLWQTAFTLQFMTHVAKYILVDPKSYKDVKNWLKSVQSASGEYIETYRDHDIMSTKSNAYLTAFVHKIMLEANEINPTTDKWLTEVFDRLTDPLDMLSTCLVLNMIKAKNLDHCNEKVDKLMSRDSTGAYWNNDQGKPSLYVTAFGLMLLSERKNKATALEVFKYIITKQKHDGNFHDCVGWCVEQDSLVTVTCMEALTKFHIMLKQYDRVKENVFVTFEIAGSDKQTIHLLPNSQVVQVVEGNATAPEVGIVAEGFGNAKATLMYQYNTNTLIEGGFNITISHTKHNDKYVMLHICTNHKDQDKTTTNNIIEIDLPSGYHYHSENFVWNKDIVDKIEGKEGDTQINVYIKQLTGKQLCIDVPTIESYNVVDRYAVPVKVYPYYDRSNMSVLPYDVDK